MSYQWNYSSISEKIRAGQDFLKTSHVPHISRNAEALIYPCLGIGWNEAEDNELPISASKIGGRADLSERLLESITDKELNPLSMEFVAQINLADLQAFNTGLRLPKSGLLSIFAKELDQISDEFDRRGVVIYTPFEPAYGDIARITGRSYSCKRPEFFETISMPMLNSAFGMHLDLYGPDEEKAYEEYYYGVLDTLGGELAASQIGGFPYYWQNDDCFPPHCTSAWNQLVHPKFRWDEENDFTVISLAAFNDSIGHQLLTWIPNDELDAGVIEDASVQMQFD